MSAGRVLQCWFAAVALGLAAAAANAGGYQQVVDGVAIYFGIVPAELVRGHPPAHPESEMHGGVPVGENHVMVALFNDKTGARLTNVKVTARITGKGGLDVEKPLKAMVIAGSQTYGNYFNMPGAGPYRIEITIRRPDVGHETRARFTWARS